MASGALDQALVSTLRSDSTLTTAAPGGVWLDVAPASASTPVIVISLQSAFDRYAFGARVAEEARYLVKAVASGPSSTGAQTAADRVDALLTDGALAITGYALHRCAREERVRYVDVDGDRVWQHVGGVYVLEAEAV